MESRWEVEALLEVVDGWDWWPFSLVCPRSAIGGWSWKASQLQSAHLKFTHLVSGEIEKHWLILIRLGSDLYITQHQIRGLLGGGWVD